MGAEKRFLENEKIEAGTPLAMQVNASRTFSVVWTRSKQHPQNTHDDDLRDGLVVCHVPLVKHLYWMVGLQREPRVLVCTKISLNIFLKIDVSVE